MKTDYIEPEIRDPTITYPDQLTAAELQAATTVLPNVDFLRLEYMAKDIADLINPNLIWDAFLPHVTINAKSILYYQDLYSNMTDPLKRIPPIRTSLGEFATVKITSIDKKSAALKGWGMGFNFDEDVVLYEDRIDDVARTRGRVAWWLSEFLNNWTIYDMTNGFSTTITSDSTLTGILTNESAAGYESTLGHMVLTMDGTNHGWAGTGADPITDIIEWQECFENQEPSVGQRYGYTLTDIYLDVPEYYDLVKYLIMIDAKWQQTPQGLTVPRIGDCRIHKIKAALYNAPDGAKVTAHAFLFDNGTKPATIYEAFDPRYGKAGHFNSHKYTEDRDHSINYQFWTNRVTVVKEPKAFGMVTGLQA